MYFLSILTILAGLSLSKGDVDCSKPPSYINTENCCQLPDFITEQIKTECMNEVQEMLSKMPGGHGPPLGGHGPPHGRHHGGPPGGHHHGHHGPHYCFMSCVINKTGILVDGELHDDNLNDYLNEIYDDSEMIDFVDGVVHKCDEKRQNHPMKKPINRHGPFQCPYNNDGMLTFCTYIHSFKECPDSVWTNTDECNELREHFRQCKPPHHYGSNEHDTDTEEEYIDEDQAEEDI